MRRRLSRRHPLWGKRQEGPDKGPGKRKYEWVFLREYGSIEDLEGSLGEFVEFFNSRRIHQGLDYMTPDEVYRQGTFPDAEEETKVA